jgi:hypothetical protein
MHCVAMSARGAMPLAPSEKSAAAMAIYSFRMQVIGRSAGRSATAAAAYRSGEQLTDERTGQVHDYTGKSDIYASEILMPENAPGRLCERETLWNEVERGERRKDSQLCNEVMIALPAELSHPQKQKLTREYVQAEFVSKGMIADIGYHDFDSHNPHAHIMLTMRPVNEEGFGKKERRWNKRDAVKEYRADWAEYANRALEQAGFDERIDHRSLKEQGLEREPQIHLGAQVMEMEARGIQTRVGDESRRISKVNRDLKRQEAKREKLQAEIAAEQKAELAAAQSDSITMGALAAGMPQDFSAESSHNLDRVGSPERLHGAAELTVEPSPPRQVGGVAEVVLRSLGIFDLDQYQAQLAEAQSSELPVEKTQEPVKRQDQPKQRQKQKVKERDLGFEM